jgi:hypothetical protein
MKFLSVLFNSLDAKPFSLISAMGLLHKFVYLVMTFDENKSFWIELMHEEVLIVLGQSYYAAPDVAFHSNACDRVPSIGVRLYARSTNDI